MPVTNVGSRWSSGDLIFYESNVSSGAIGNILTLGDDAVTVGSATNDVDLKVFLGSASEYVLFDVGNSRVDYGVDGTGVDVRFFGDTASSLMTWDQSADALVFDNADVHLGDNDVVGWGDAQDITITWDATRLNVAQATANSEIRWGVDGAGIDQRWYGDTASSYMLWDQTADKLIINAGTADLGTSCEADAYTVGGSAGVDYSAAVANITVVKGIVTAAS